jgi:hypothetical protein
MFAHKPKEKLVGHGTPRRPRSIFFATVAKLASWEASPETSAETLTRYGRKICGIISKLTSRETLWKTS